MRCAIIQDWTRNQLCRSTIEIVVACVRFKRSCSLSLGSNNCDHLVTLGVCTALGAESLASKLDGELFLLLDASSNHFEHFAFVGSEARDLVHDGANSGDSGVKFALAVRFLNFVDISSLLWFSDNESVVKADEQSSLCKSHLVYFK